MAILCLLVSCSGVDNRGDDEPLLLTTTAAYRSLRLGQTEDPGSPVATTAGANNGEAIIVLNRAPGSTSVDHVLYVSPATQVARITYDNGNLPSTAEGQGTSFVFSNYTETTVDVTAIPSEGNTFTVTLPLDDVVRKVVSQLGGIARLARAEPDDVIRALYARAIIGMRLFGCGSLSAFAVQGAAVPAAFQPLGQAACSSLLVDLLRAFLASDDFSTRVITGLREEPSCNFSSPGWIESFANAEQCALGISSQLLSEIYRIFPDLEAALQGTPTPTPQPTATPSSAGDNGDSDTSSLRCDRGKFRCDDGGRTCNENACDGRNDCRDGSDESSSLCTAEVLCCINSNGCPGENAGTCTLSCCCCPSGKRCSRSPFLRGCVNDN